MVFHRGLIYLDRVDRPVHVLELSRILRHPLLASRGHCRARPRLPYCTGPHPAEGGVDHDLHVLEMSVDVTLSRELGRRDAPVTGIGHAVRDVERDLGAGKEPDLDGGGRPLGRVYPAAEVVELLTVRVRAAVLGSAAHVVVLPGSLIVAVGG